MDALRSQLYHANVYHRRLRPKPHRLQYKVGMFLFDLEELPRLDADLRFFSYNRANLFSFCDADFGPGDNRPLREHVDRLIADAGLANTVTQVTLLCYPRIAGYIFNPIAVYYCNGTGGVPVCIIYEVTNTFRERHSYVIPVSDSSQGVIKQACSKALYVSPFNAPDAQYDFHIKAPGDDLTLSIRQSDADGPLLDASLLGRRMDLTDSNLLRLFCRFPFLTAKVMLAIHWEAAKLWFKGLQVFRHRKTTHHGVSLIPASHNRNVYGPVETPGKEQ